MKEVLISDATPRKTGEEWSIALPEYNPQFKDALKAAVPPSARRWDPQMKVWVVADEWMEVVEELVVRYFPNAQVNWYE